MWPTTGSGLPRIELPQVFTPAHAAEILRGAGLTGITECALRTRAYRKQVPFHLNGRRVVFTLNDLREIAEGEERRPRPTPPTVAAAPAVPVPRRRATSRCPTVPADPWRARTPRTGTQPKRRATTNEAARHVRSRPPAAPQQVGDCDNPRQEEM